MPFDPDQWPNAVTIGWPIAERMGMGVHCQRCGMHAVLDPATLHLSPEMPMPSLAGRFKCSRCGSKQTEARPEWPERDG
jgi:DNA-directed RNA polymerase subunit RPC12/RpoP